MSEYIWNEMMIIKGQSTKNDPKTKIITTTKLSRRNAINQMTNNRISRCNAIHQRRWSLSFCVPFRPSPFFPSFFVLPWYRSTEMISWIWLPLKGNKKRKEEMKERDIRLILFLKKKTVTNAQPNRCDKHRETNETMTQISMVDTWSKVKGVRAEWKTKNTTHTNIKMFWLINEKSSYE